MDDKIFTVALQDFINSNFTGIAPKVELEFYSGSKNPAALIKAGAFTPVKRYLTGGGQFLLAFYIVFKTNAAEDKEKAFDYLNAIGTWLTETSKTDFFRASGIPSIKTLDLGTNYVAISSELTQSPVDITGEDADGIALYQATFNLKFKAKGAI